MPKKQKIPPYRLHLANTLGVFGYMSCITQWAWTGIVLLPALAASGFLQFLLPQESTNDMPVITFEASPTVVAIVLILTAAVIAASVVAILRLPRDIGKAGKRVTHEPATAVLPTITHHKKLSKKKKLELTYRIVQVIKLLLVVLPFIGLLLTFFVTVDIAHQLIFIVGGFCAVISLLWFGLQTTLAYWWRLPTDKLI